MSASQVRSDSRTTAAAVNGGVVLRDGRGVVELHPLWLRERSTTCGATDPVNGQRLFEPTDIPADLAVLDAEVVADGTTLFVVFTDGHQMTLPLAAIGRPNEARPEPTPWLAPDVEVATIDYTDLASPDERLGRCARGSALEAFFRSGFFVLRNAPTEPGALHEITSHFGRVSPTNFGSLFDVRTEPVALDLAYTPVALSAHTDQPYRAPTPGLQFLHTIVNDAPGGASTIVDGLAAVRDLAQADPVGYEVLCSLIVEFRYDVGSDVKVHRAPVIERWPDGSLRQLRFSPRLDFAPIAPRETLDAYYRSRHWLAEALNDPLRQVEYRMSAGDVLVVDNHRVLHGRRSFDPTQGHRHLQGCYIDHDGPVTEWILAGRTEGP